MNPKEIIDVFSYTEEEQKAFFYLREYMNRVNGSLLEIEQDPEKLKRFALAGLFLTYRSFNHQGESMSTQSKNTLSQSRRMVVFREQFGSEIESTEDYLSLIGLSFTKYLMMNLRIGSISKHLYKFVAR